MAEQQNVPEALDEPKEKEAPPHLAPRQYADLRKSLSSKVMVQREWTYALLFLEGKQHLRWSKKSGSFDQIRQDTTERTVVTANRLLNIYRNIGARFITNYPGCVVLPATPSVDDIVKAGISSNATRYFWSAAEIDVVFGSAARWLMTCGTTAFHTYFCPEKEDAVCKSVNPFNLFFEPGAEEVEQSDWLSIRSYHTKAKLKKAYASLGEDVLKRIDELAEVEPADARTFGRPYSSTGTPLKRVEVYETYWRDGRHLIQAKDVPLFYEDDVEGGIPIDVVYYTEIPLLLWGKSLLDALLELQWLYNKSRSQVVQNIDLMVNPKWLIPKNAGTDENAFTNEPGEKIYFNGNAKYPKQLETVPLPAHVSENITRLSAEIEDTAGVHSVSLGKRSVGVHSGEAIKSLSAKDASQLQMTQDGLEKAARKIARRALLLMKKHYPEEKMLRMMDRFGKVTFETLRRTDILEDPEIFIQAGALFQDNAEDRDQRTLDLLKLGLLTPEEARHRLSSHIGDTEYLKEIADKAHAQDLLRAILSGYQIEIFASDNLKAFHEVFQEYMRGEHFYDQPEHIRQYIRDAFVAIEAMGNPEAIALAQAQFKIFPSEAGAFTSPLHQADTVAAQESGSAAEQQLGEIAAAQQKRAMVGQIGSAIGGAERATSPGRETDRMVRSDGAVQ